MNHTICDIFVWFLSLSIVFLRLICVVACISTSFFFNMLLYGYATFCLSIHQLMAILIVSILRLLWILPLWKIGYKTVWIQVSISLGEILGSRIAGWYGKFMFNVLNCQTVLQSGCAILHFHKQWMKVLVFSTSLQCLLLSFWLQSF